MGEVFSTGDSPIEITLLKVPPEVEEWKTKLKRDPLALQGAPGYIRENRDLVRQAVSEHSRALLFAAPALRDDRKFVLSLVACNGCALGSASEAMKGDPEVATAAVIQNEYALKYVAAHLRREKDFLLHVARKNRAVTSVLVSCRRTQTLLCKFRQDFSALE